jgi:hypothetical protein
MALLRFVIGEVLSVVDCCANPGCDADFRLFHSGDLYALERHTADTEFFWLCSECAPQYDLLLSAEGRVSFHPRSEGRRGRPANPDSTLRLVSSDTHGFPWGNSTPVDGPRALRKLGERRELAN